MKTKQLVQIKDYKIIHIWKSVGEASRMGGFNPSLIRAVCLGERKTHRGYEWYYVDVNDLEAQIGIKKPIVCKYKNGKRIEFPSKKEAAASLHIPIQSIQNILLNRKKQYVQFELSYKNA